MKSPIWYRVWRWLVLAWWRFGRRYLVRCFYVRKHEPDRRSLYFPEDASGERLTAWECRHCGRYVSDSGALVRTRTPPPLTGARG